MKGLIVLLVLASFVACLAFESEKANKSESSNWHWRTNDDSDVKSDGSLDTFDSANEVYSSTPDFTTTTEISHKFDQNEDEFLTSASSELSGNSSKGNTTDLDVNPALYISGRSAGGRQRGREARIINDPKISIQGFIPIVGLNQQDKIDKKYTDEHTDFDDESLYHPSKGPVYVPESSTSSSKFINSYNKGKNTYTSERPLYTETSNAYSQGIGKDPESHYAGPEDAKFLGALAQALRPSKPEPHYSQSAGYGQRKCVCVPFYLCKNGYLVSSGRQEAIDERSAARSYSYENETAPAYASDVLARMIGAGVTGECGLLRTCCKVPGGHEDHYPHPSGSHIGSLLGGSYPVHRPKPNRVSGHQRPFGQYPIGVNPAFKPGGFIDSIPLGTIEYPPEVITKPGYPHSVHRPIHGHPSPVYPPPRPYPVPQPAQAYSTCGVRNGFGIHGRIKNLQYHDDSTEFGEYPWQAAILKKLGPVDSLYVCGGVLIASQWIATAAHCVKSVGPYDLKVRLGEWDVHREDEFYPYVEKFVQDIFVHPEFFPGNLVHDIALLRLDSPVDLNNPHIAPACLPDPHDSFVGQRCWVTGWGKDAFGNKGEYQAVLKEVDLPVLAHHDCQNRLRKTRLGPYYTLHPAFLCAGGEPGKDACEGDGGSPLVCERHGVWKAVGLVSWGIGCGKPGVPGVYVNLGKYRPWIDSFINRYGYPGYRDSGNSPISERSNSGASQSSSQSQETKVRLPDDAKAESRAD